MRRLCPRMTVRVPVLIAFAVAFLLLHTLLASLSLPGSLNSSILGGNDAKLNRLVKDTDELKQILVSMETRLNFSLTSIANGMGRLIPHFPGLAVKGDKAVENAANALTCPAAPVNTTKDSAWTACEVKSKWMQAFWKSDSCYAEYGVDEHPCSHKLYLAYIENWCAPLRDARRETNGTDVFIRLNLKDRSLVVGPLPRPPSFAEVKTSKAPARFNATFDSLEALMRQRLSEGSLDFMLARVKRLWPQWTAALERLTAKHAFMKIRRKLTIVVFMGFLGRTDLGKLVGKGGPLGEFVQWSDVIASLHVAGHDVILATKKDNIKQTLIDLGVLTASATSSKGSCPPMNKPSAAQDRLDLLFTDIHGLKDLENLLKVSFNRLSCRFRVVDSFGTQAPFNSKAWATNKKKYASSWGKHDLHLGQFYTMFPHTPDNTFLGFVVDGPPSLSSTSEPSTAFSLAMSDYSKRVLVYGKRAHMWVGHSALLRRLHDAGFEVHGTVADGVGNTANPLPDFVINHGLLDGAGFQRLQAACRFFLGLGFPYEGPAPLEAIANGAVFVNPKFDPPHGRGKTAFFAAKPTGRLLTSQHPYLEDFVGFPSILTVALSDVEGVVEQLRNISSTPWQRSSHLPFEFTIEGTLERVVILTENQRFCPEDAASPTRRRWPPKSALVLTSLGEFGQGCDAFCASKGRLCGPDFFPDLNSPSGFERVEQRCLKTLIETDLHHPSMDNGTSTCVFQKEKLLFSCDAKPPATVRRLCPCRDFVAGQTALCRDCYFSQEEGKM